MANNYSSVGKIWKSMNLYRIIMMIIIVVKGAWVMEDIYGVFLLFSVSCKLHVWLHHPSRRKMRLSMCGWIFAAEWLHVRVYVTTSCSFIVMIRSVTIGYFTLQGNRHSAEQSIVVRFSPWWNCDDKFDVRLKTSGYQSYWTLPHDTKL